MSTADRLVELADSEGYPLCCMAIPHSVENDIGFTDHCFGYGTAARWNAIVTGNVGRDAEARRIAEDVKIIETMGHNSGWLVAATALAKDSNNSAPHLIYLPESGLDIARFLADVESVYSRLGYCLVTVSEGVKDKEGSSLDPDDQSEESVGVYLCSLIAKKLKLKASCDKLSMFSQSVTQPTSEVDSGEALMAGQAVVRRVVDGMNGFMITIS